jgi:hypothetical protein
MVVGGGGNRVVEQQSQQQQHQAAIHIYNTINDNYQPRQIACRSRPSINAMINAPNYAPNYALARWRLLGWWSCCGITDVTGLCAHLGASSS